MTWFRVRAFRTVHRQHKNPAWRVVKTRVLLKTFHIDADDATDACQQMLQHFPQADYMEVTPEHEEEEQDLFVARIQDTLARARQPDVSQSGVDTGEAHH